MKDKIKLAQIGLGRRGYALLRDCFSDMADVEMAVLCDRYAPSYDRAAELFTSKGKKAPAFTQDFDEVIHNPEIDGIIICTGWQEHGELAKKSMLAGKYTAIEVGCAFDLRECYELIEVYERTKTPLMMLENCCYGRRELMALNIVKQGLFGDVVHCDGGYHHYLCAGELLVDLDNPNPHYRLDSYIKRNCEQYPTHELGPISKVLGINCGNRFMTLSSFASKSGGLKRAAERFVGEDSDYAKINYKQGDIITTILTCANGETVRLCLDTTAPRPYYSRDFTVRGTKGMCAEENNVVFFEGMKEPVKNNEAEMFEQYDHPIHKEYNAIGARGGHDGMDWLVCRAFVESIKSGTETPISAYDSVLWMAIASLSEQSINLGGAPVPVPDFTNGKWMSARPANTGKYSLDVVVEDSSIPIIP